jgi:hypothetical protein
MFQTVLYTSLITTAEGVAGVAVTFRDKPFSQAGTAAARQNPSLGDWLWHRATRSLVRATVATPDLADQRPE